MPKREHKVNCCCSVCKIKRGEFIHKDSCKCFVCLAKRNVGKSYESIYGKEAYEKHQKSLRTMVHKANCLCSVCKAKRGEKKGISPNHKKDCQCAYCNTQRGGSSHPMFGRKNELSPVWVGDKIRSGVHAWLRRIYGKANCCENTNCLGKSTCFEWSKVDHNTPYIRRREDYQKLCHICHKGYDAKPIMINGRYGWIKIISKT